MTSARAVGHGHEREASAVTGHDDQSTRCDGMARLIRSV
jgi:hypothetical protein